MTNGVKNKIFDPALRDYAWQHAYGNFPTDTAAWSRGSIVLGLHAFWSDLLPPEDLITAARCIVTRGDEILLCRNVKEAHILPGGRCEPGETLEETLAREVCEETGWSIGAPRLLGWIHGLHRTPKPAGYDHPYPEFVQVVYAAPATTFDSAARLADDYELSADFVPLADLDQAALSHRERAFLIRLVDTRPLDRLYPDYCGPHSLRG